MNYVNYHSHSMYSNIMTPDVVIRNEDKCNRVLELGQKVLSGVEHGYCGRFIEIYELSKKNNLKPLYGTEAYFVENRLEKDRTNAHLMLLAKNDTGRKAINRILSEANLSGYYYKPRVDIELVLSLPKDDIWVTSACLGGIWKYENHQDIFEQIVEHFRNNFFFEVQNHPVDSQKELNKHILELSRFYGVSLIAGMDTHIIDNEEKEDREEYLASRGIVYEDEQGWNIDFPDYETAFQRFADQGVLNEEETELALNNTNVLEEVSKYNSPIFTKEVKLPSIHKNKTQTEKNELLATIIWKEWEKEKKNVPSVKHELYEAEIKKELDVVYKTNIADYFLLDYEIIKRGKELGGMLTLTGRGCFTKDSLVLTSDGLKNISNIKKGDSVVNEDGEFVPVYDVMSYNVNEELIKITHIYGTNKHNEMICTKNHKILIYRNNSVQWVEAQNIVKGDFVCYPKIKTENKSEKTIDLSKYINNKTTFFDDLFIYEKTNGVPYPYSPSELSRKYGTGKSTFEKFANRNKNVFSRKKTQEMLKDFYATTPFKSQEQYSQYVDSKRIKKINRFIENDSLFNVFIGLMYGDGYVNDESNRVGLAINNSTKKDCENRNVFEEISKRIGIEIYENISKSRKLSQLYLNSETIANYVRKELFVSKKGKEKIFNSNLFFQDKENLLGILKGFMLSDGHYSGTIERDCFDNTSLSLIGAFKIISSICGLPVLSIQKRESFYSGKYLCKDSYKLKICKNAETTTKKEERCFSNKNFYFMPVKEIINIGKRNTKVYDLSVLGKHSYVINNMIVHNSAPSYFLCKLLGFTTIDRISAEVKMFPERFISAERLIEAKSIPDIDYNIGNPEVFAQAQEEILEEGHSYKMIAFGKVKELSAWKMYARQAGVKFEIANEISSQIQAFEEEYKYADDEEKERLDIHDYLEKHYHIFFDASKKFLGVVNDVKPHPCGYLLSDFDIREEFGLIRLKSGNNENICACVDGKWIEDYKMLKNDLLKVQVVEVIYKTFQKIGIEPYPLPEMIKMCNDDEKVWNIYGNGATISVNQFEKDSTSAKGKRYSPKNISEISAFVAAIRPGFQSSYHDFESRKEFSYGVKSLDEIIQTEEFPYSYMLYQENAMAVMGWAGIPMYQTYEIVKAIAKKRYDDVLKNKEIFINGMKKRLVSVEKISEDRAKEIALATWKIIEDSSRYSFNVSHSYSVAGDSLYCAWLKANYPVQFYETFMEIMEEDGSKDRIDLAKQEAEKFFNINFPNPKFGQDNRRIFGNPEKNEITQSLTFYKGFGDKIGQQLYDLADKFDGNDFLDLLIFAEENGYVSSKWETLIELNYFSDFGPNKKLLLIWKEFRSGKSKYSSKLSEKTRIKRLDELKEIWYNLPDESLSVLEQVGAEIKILGRIQSTFDIDKRYCFVFSVDTKYTPKIKVQSLATGKQMELKIQKKIFLKKEISPNTIIYCNEFEKKFGGRFEFSENGEKNWVEDKTQTVWWLSDYHSIKKGELE